MDSAQTESAAGSLVVRGARDHNLQDVDLTIEHGRWTSIVGPSGSGKTTLVFDTLVREGEGRFLGALSARARHFFGKLGRADATSITGLPVPIAVGRRSAGGHPRSTVGTQTGVLDLLRLLFAREATHPDESKLTRSHFSFNVPEGACEPCGGLGVADSVDPLLLVADGKKSIREGALVPTLPSGYTVYSQVTVDVMDTICRAHGFDVDTPWDDLTDQQRDVVLYGTRALKVPFGKHALESRMKWEGITAKPREEGYYRGLVPVIEETLKRNRNPNILRFVRSVPCGACGGSRLGSVGRSAALPSGATLPTWLALGADQLARALAEEDQRPVLRSVWESIEPRLRRMEALGLGHLAFDRVSTSLSGGEAQRLRLASHLAGGLSRALYALDEPTLGLHPESQAGMRDVLDELVAAGNTLVVVEHDPDMVASADRVVAMGPGAGPEGGTVVADVRGPTRALGEQPVPKARRERGPRRRIRLEGATMHNLDDAFLEIEEGSLHVVVGPSGAGKTSLVFGTLLPALAGGVGGPYRTLNAEFARDARAVDARPMGRSSRSTPGTWSGAFDAIRARFASTNEARALGWKAGHFSFNTKGGRCVTCEGIGSTRVGLHLLEDAVSVCDGCGGARYDAETCSVLLRGASIADVNRMTISEAAVFFAEDEGIEPLLRQMADLGIGYLPLGTPSTQLSSGEAQRVRLATLLATAAKKPSLYVFDEPDRGLHPDDLRRLVSAFDKLTGAGHAVLAVSHHRHLWAAADALTEVRDGRTRSVTLDELRAPALPARRRRPAPPTHMRLRGVSTNNLQAIDVDIEHDRVTAIVGPSGSGKTSLAFDTVAAEAWHRFSESLPFQVRRFMERAPRPIAREITGLGPVVALRQFTADLARSEARTARTTIATESGMGELLRLVFSRAGLLDGAPHSLTAGHFSTERSLGACATCSGRGVRQQCTPETLRIDESKSIVDGAFAATKPGAFFTDASDRHVATMRVAAADDLTRPWSELPDSVRRVVLEGTGDAVHRVRWEFQRGAREGEHDFEGTWDGLVALIDREATRRSKSRTKAAQEWGDVLADVPCVVCDGTGLQGDARRVTVQGRTLPDMLALRIHEVAASLEGDHPALRHLRPEVAKRCGELIELRLGSRRLADTMGQLSRGDWQRVRIASALRSHLAGVTVVLDEPTIGLDAAGARAVGGKLQAVARTGRTVLVVTHRRELIEAADRVLELGPGAGDAGGELIAHATCGEWMAGESPLAQSLSENPPARIVGSADRIEAAGVSVPRAGLVVVASEAEGGPVRLATSPFSEELGAHFDVAASTRELARGAFVVTALGAMPALQRAFHEAATASGLDLPRAAFSFQSPKGRCAACGGAGVETIAMDFTADLRVPCASCGGTRYRPEVLEAQWQGRSVAEVLGESAGQLIRESAVADSALGAVLAAMQRVGLGHIALGRALRTLSGGERQRLALAVGICARRKGQRMLFVLDEPDAGLAESDVRSLVDELRRLADAGDLIVATSFRPALIAAATEEVTIR